MEASKAFAQARDAERALAESEARFRAMVEQSISGIYVIQDERFAYVNPRFAEIFGYGSPAEIIGRNPDDLVAPRDRLVVAQNLRRRLSGEIHSLAYTFTGVRKDGSELEVGVHGSVATFAGRPAVIGALQDISERARAERERQQALDELNATASRLAKVNRALRTLSAGNETLVRSTDEADLLHNMCRVIVQSGGYRFAAVGYVQPGAGRPIAPQASAGIPLEELRHIPMPRADPGHPLAPSPSAIASNAPLLYLDPANDPSLAAWRELIVRYELACAVSMPLRASEHSTPYGVLVIGASDRDAFDPEAIRLLEELANDLAFGIGILRLREDQRASAAALRKSLEDTILAIAATTEMRDPYTAGHERRVAELAASIAREMGLAEPAIEGIRFGAMIHDLGKIKIPAEILVKPTRLTPIEYELIKQHAQAGYDILKGIDFPWPVAQMVLQHHERIDGSGYPQGLKGDAIIREARILAVADTVEAMSSHRPYRPGLGLDKALAEIERVRDVLYDAQTVDACLRLFREKGYTLPA
jgi:PAS domain S-box-containing protein/putative nucleotidyltransferase with HDIG domain